MGEAQTSKKIELDEVMLAMDVVDTLRHQQSLVDRELMADDRDQDLIEKVRKIYAGQGIDVSEAVIARGVADLREERFTYTPPPKSFQLMLARWYVNRGRWSKKGILLLAALFVVYLIYQFAYLAPQKRSRQKAADAINLRIDQQRDQISVAQERMGRLNQTLVKVKQAGLSKATAAFTGLADAAVREIATAQEKIRSLAKLAIKPDFDARRATQSGDAVVDRLDKRRELISALNVHLDRAEKAVAALGGLRVLPEKLAEQRKRVLAEAREEDARRQAEKLYNDAMTAMGQGDVTAAEKRYGSLKQLYAHLVEEYQLRIVSRQGMPSGVWRLPKNNPGARNYYIIVEAVASDGRRLTAPITSEEDGKTRNVKQWGLRVKAPVFEQVKRDKQDDGIISRNIFGVKKRGFLHPQYLIPTTGGAITQW